MKRISILLVILLAVAMLFSMTACNGDGDGDGDGDVPKKDITGVTMSNATFTYDGTEKKIEVSGALPTGVSVEYENNKATNAGNYDVTATLSGEGYNTLTLTASLVINKAQISGITAEENQTVDSDGELHLPTYTGTAPTGVSVKYFIDGTETAGGVSAIGTYNFKIRFTGSNYETLELPVTYKIAFNALNFASSVVNSFGTAPDPWNFLPSSFEAQNHTVSSIPGYASFVNVSDIPVNGIGKQMNVVYGLLNKTSAALSYVNVVMNSLNGIKTLYSTYIDQNPNNYESYTGTISGFTFTLELEGNSYTLVANVGTVEVKIFSNIESEEYGAKVELADNTAIKYTVSDDSLLIAMNILNTVSTQLQFERNDEGYMVGALYEYLTVSGTEITATSAMIEVGEDYTVVIGTKGDFLPLSVSRNCEIYDNETGCLVGTKVREDMEGTVYNTYWFPLCSLSGVNSIKKEDVVNGLNPDTIYINGVSSDTIHTKFMGISYALAGKSTSRRFDIEFKTVYGYTYDEQSEEYKQVSYEIPMLSIQEEVIDSFESDFEDANENTLTASGVTLMVNEEDFEAIARGYQILLPLYDEIKGAVTQDMISSYCAN